VNAGTFYRKNDMDGIVSDGEKRYRKALIEEEHRILEELTAKMKAEKDPILQSELKEKIKQVKREYKEKLKIIKWSLFGKG
jgi:DNA-binding transcriptional regulator GbsR (MarR family)